MTIDWKKQFDERGIDSKCPWLRSLGHAWDERAEDAPLSGKWAVMLVARWSAQDRLQLFDVAKYVVNSNGRFNLAFQFFDDHQEVRTKWPTSKIARQDCFITPLWLLVQDGVIVKEKALTMNVEAFQAWYESPPAPVQSKSWELRIDLIMLIGMLTWMIGTFFAVSAISWIGALVFIVPLIGILIRAAGTLLYNRLTKR